jgi:hypothetical protein
MITYTVSAVEENETHAVYDIQNANICLGPCPSVREEGYILTSRLEGPMTASGCFTRVVEKMWELKPYSGGHYTLHYPYPGVAYGDDDGPGFVFQGMRICSRCNARYLEQCSELEFSELPDPEIRRTMARDCIRILLKLENHATEVTVAGLQPG